MTAVPSKLLGAAASALLILAAPALLPAVSRPAHAQGGQNQIGIGETETTDIRATVKAVDAAARTVTLTDEQGRTATIQVGPEVRNLPQVRPGDIVMARKTTSATYILAPRGVKTPPDNATFAMLRAAPGQMPAGAIGTEITVTGVVVAVDQGAKTISLVDPSGGMIRTVTVKSQAGLENLKYVKPGDRITAILTETVSAIVVPPSA